MPGAAIVPRQLAPGASRAGSAGTNRRAARSPGSSALRLRCSTSPMSARGEEHDPERLLDGDRVLAEAPRDARPVLDLDVRLPAVLRDGEAVHAEDERGARSRASARPSQLDRLRRRGGRNDRRRPAGAASRREQHGGERDQDGDGALHPAMLAHAPERQAGWPSGRGGSSIASRAAWISTSTRARSSSGGSGSPSPTGGSRRPRARRGRRPRCSAAPSSSRRRCSPAGAARRAGSSSPRTPHEAEERAKEILGLDIRGHVVRKLWIEKASDIAKEYYLSLTFDRGAKQPLFMFTTQGGVEIEQVAEESPDALVQLHVDPLEGFHPWQARRLVYGGGCHRPVRAEADRRDRREALRGVRRLRRDALRDQPADRHARRRGQGARLEVHRRRQRALPPPRHRRDARPRGGRPARGARAREARHLREARRRGRRARQRRRA